MGRSIALGLIVLTAWCVTPSARSAIGCRLVLDMVRLTQAGKGDGEIDINPAEVDALRSPPDARGGHFHPDVHCLVYTADGRQMGVVEDCPRVRELLRAGKSGDAVR